MTLRGGQALLVLSLCLTSATAAAAPPVEGSAEATAALSFEEGVRAFSSGDYAHAAEAFDAAYAAKPHHDALWNGARARERTGEHARAANLYARYLREAPSSAPDRDRALVALQSLARGLGRLEIHAGPDVPQVDVDGAPGVLPDVYVSPGEHVVEGTGGGERRTVNVAAGESVSVTIDARPPAVPAFAQPQATSTERRGLPPWVVLAGAAATIGLGAVTIWSALDTVEQKKTFDASRSQEDLDDGVARQTRTNVLLGVTVGLAALTGVTALFVDWAGVKQRTALDSPRARMLRVDLGLATFAVRGAF